MKKGLLVGVLAAGLCIGASGTASALLIGDFEGGASPFTTVNAGGTVDGWLVTGGSVDWIGDYWQAASGTGSLDLSGTAPGTIARLEIATTPGQAYEVTFAMAGNPDGLPVTKTLEASVLPAAAGSPWTFTFDSTGKTRDAMGWEERSFTFVASDAITSLAFGDLSGAPGFYGAAIDNINIDPVPEPGTILLLGGGLLGLAGFGRRRRMRK